MRFILLILFCFCFILGVKAQESDSIRAILDTANTEIADTLSQDTVKSKRELRRERREKEKIAKEREKFYYNDILKDSTRLAIEDLSRVAWRRSMILPGWGQYSNGGAWWIKVPVIYGGFVTAYLVLDYWQWYYKKFGDEAAYRINNVNGKSDPDLIAIDQLDYLINQKDYARRNRDLTVLVTIGWWGLNVVEAYTNSILKFRYDIRDDLSMKITPTIMPTANQFAFAAPLGGQFAPGLKLTMSLR